MLWGGLIDPFKLHRHLNELSFSDLHKESCTKFVDFKELLKAIHCEFVSNMMNANETLVTIKNKRYE